MAISPIPKIYDAAQDFMPINGTDYIELYVSNAKQAAHYYKSAFGFQSLAYKGLETGSRDQESYVVIQDKIRLVLTSPLRSGTEIGKHIDTHGDGVKVTALWVDDATYAYEEAMKRGATHFMAPTVESDKDGHIVKSGIYTYGEVVHIFIERKNYQGVFLPGFQKWETFYNPSSIGLKYVDHMVGNVHLGRMNHWVDFYEKVMGFTQILSFDDKDISTEYTALMSKVMSNGNGRIKFPINEPAAGLKKSQVDEYLEFYEGEGVQHIAVATDNIIETVTALKNRGVEFSTGAKYLLRCPGRAGRGRLMKTLTVSGPWESWWTAMKKATYCKFSPKPFRPDLPCFLKSSNAREPVLLVRGISRPCLKPWNASRL